MVNGHRFNTVKIYIEGGGDQSRLKTECRRAFTLFFEKAGFRGRMPRVVACGSRNEAYSNFCTALKSRERSEVLAFLLVDSEDAVDPIFQDSPWGHLKNRDNWDQPHGANDEQVHLMIECMENWFLANPEVLQTYFGQGFNINALPVNTNVERIAKIDVIKAIENASRRSRKGLYQKGDHSFKILEELNVTKVIAAFPSVRRLIHELDKVL